MQPSQPIFTEKVPCPSDNLCASASFIPTGLILSCVGGLVLHESNGLAKLTCVLLPNSSEP